MTTGKKKNNIALTRWAFVGKVMSLLFNILSMFVIAFLPRSKHPLISWLQSPSAVISAKMGTIKDRNGMGLTEAENIKKRWQEYTELYKKDLHYPDNHDGVITHLEPDILECEVKWALGSTTMNKVRGGDGIPVELFQIPKDDAVKVLHSICQPIWKIQ